MVRFSIHNDNPICFKYPSTLASNTLTSVRLYPTGTSSASARRPFPTALPMVPRPLFTVFAFQMVQLSLDALQLGYKFLFRRQIELVFRCVDIGFFR